MDTSRDPELWEHAKKRAGFRMHFLVYILMSIIFWLVWGFTIKINVAKDINFPWPLFPMIGWGVGVFLHYMGAYHWRKKWEEKEYNKLIKQKENNV